MPSPAMQGTYFPNSSTWSERLAGFAIHALIEYFYDRDLRNKTEKDGTLHESSSWLFTMKTWGADFIDIRKGREHLLRSGRPKIITNIESFLERQTIEIDVKISNK